MTGSIRSVGLAFSLVTLVFANHAWAQENLQAGMTGAQLYAADCAICHKSLRKLSGFVATLGLESFISEHYTASRESATKITAYLRETAVGLAPLRHRRAVKHPLESTKRAKSVEKSKAERGKKFGKSPEASTYKTKPAEVETGKVKGGRTKSHTTKSAIEKPDAVRSSQADAPRSKTSKSKSDEAKTSKSGPAEAKTSETITIGGNAQDEPKQSKTSKPSNGKTGSVQARKRKPSATDKQEKTD